jgi:hypothetical protein
MKVGEKTGYESKLWTTQHKVLSQGNRVLFILGRSECSEIGPGFSPVRRNSDVIMYFAITFSS